MLSIDLKFARLLSGRLKNFKQTRPNTFGFSHSCERDQGGGKFKSRGGFYPKNGDLNFYCFNCSESSKFSTFLKNEDPNLYAEYRLEVFRETKTSTKTSIVIYDIPEVIEPVIEQINNDIIFLTDLSDNHPVKQYAINRSLPVQYYDRIGYVKAFNKFASIYNDRFTNFAHDHPRLIFPFYDSNGKDIICYSGRSFGKEQPKYIKITVDPSRPKIYGLWRIDEREQIFVTEGQIDSLFVDNCVAIGSADYSSEWIQTRKDRIVIIPDSDYKRNEFVYSALEKAIDSGFSISLFPESIPWKDINDCVVKGGINVKDINRIVNQNVISGLTAKIELSFRRKF